MTHWTLKKLQRKLDILEEKIKNHLPDNIYRKYIHFINDKVKYCYKKIKLAHIKKYHNLIATVEGRDFNLSIQNRLINKSGVPLNEVVCNTLSLGASFSFHQPLNNFILFEIIKNAEYIISDNFQNHQANICRAKIINITTNAFQKYKVQKQDRFYKAFIETKKFVAEHPELVFIGSVKGNLIVVLSATQYDDRMRDLLNDECTYKRVDTDNTVMYENKSNKLLRELL